MLFNDPLGLWYIDLNGTFMVLPGYVVTGGFMIGTGGLYGYWGVGVGEFGGSLTWSPNDPVEGMTVGLTGGGGLGGQIGSDINNEGFWEVGFVTPGWSYTAYEITNLLSFWKKDKKKPTSGCPP